MLCEKSKCDIGEKRTEEGSLYHWVPLDFAVVPSDMSLL